MALWAVVPDDSRIALLAAASSVAVYVLGLVASRALTPRLLKNYRRLSHKDQQEWHYRVPSTVHAVIITALAAYIFFGTGDFYHVKEGVPTILVHSPRSTFALAFSFGYFAIDLAATLAEYPTLGGPDMLAHHVAALSSVGTALALGEGHAATLFMLATECTTPFVNLRWWLSAAGHRESGAYVANGLAMLLIWTIGRVASFPLFFLDLYRSREDLARAAAPLRVQIVLVPAILFVLNLVWYAKMLRGARRALFPAAGRGTDGVAGHAADAGGEGSASEDDVPTSARPKRFGELSPADARRAALVFPESGRERLLAETASLSSSDAEEGQCVDGRIPTPCESRSPAAAGLDDVASRAASGTGASSRTPSCVGLSSSGSVSAASSPMEAPRGRGKASSAFCDSVLVEHLGATPPCDSPFGSPRHGKVRRRGTGANISLDADAAAGHGKLP